ncbi:MAG TPA: PAS domain S-box protein, partial [Bacteroidetes bacterium]|nr:PAS domain S-box protein [Bacteroidota bacterium]
MKKSQVILLSDSNSGHLELMEIAIRKVLKNAQIVRVSAMDECLRLLPDIFLDLVILNLVAGSRTELDMLAKIHAFNPCLPILIITGQGNEKAVVRAMKSSVHDYLIKSTGYLTTLPVTVTRILRETEEKCSLYQTEQYYKDLVENASDGIYLLDDAGYIRLVNKMCAQKTGYKRNQLIGRHFSFLFSEEDQKKLLYKVKRNQKLKRVIKYQTSILCTSEKRLPVELSIIPVKSNETVIGYQGIIRDVSEEIRLQEERKKRTEEIQRMNEELMEKNKKLNELHQLKTQFISNVGHELRTPLTSILGYTELLREGVYGQLESGQ